MTDGPSGPVIDNLSEIKFELMQLNLYVRDLLTSSVRDMPAPVVHVAPAAVHVAAAALPAPLDLSMLRHDATPVVEGLGRLQKTIEDLASGMRAIAGSSSPASGSSYVTAEILNKPNVELAVADAAKDTRYEWQSVAASSVPLYSGTAQPGTATSAATWRVQKYTYITGPAGDAVPSLIQTATGAWDSRASLFP